MLKSKVEGKIKALKKLPMKTKIVIAVGLAGILLIFVSEMFPAKNTAESKSIPTESVATDDTDSYKKQIEKEKEEWKKSLKMFFLKSGELASAR